MRAAQLRRNLDTWVWLDDYPAFANDVDQGALAPQSMTDTVNVPVAEVQTVVSG